MCRAIRGACSAGKRAVRTNGLGYVTGNAMPIDAEEETGNLVHLSVRGKLTGADQAALMYFVAKAVERHGRIRLLVTLAGFTGWTADENAWSDDALRIQDDATVVKAAFVGDVRWKDQVFAFVAQPFRAIPIEYFSAEQVAREWLTR
jgi:hypothetical protein